MGNEISNINVTTSTTSASKPSEIEGENKPGFWATVGSVGASYVAYRGVKKYAVKH